jgi:aminoglycoside phosphotransferase (APT) family kinase protein
LVADLLGQAVISWKIAPHGADHLILLVTMNDGNRVVVKAGAEAHVDAIVIKWLRGIDVKVPALIARSEIEADGTVFPIAVMSHIDGSLLADASRPTVDYLPSLIEQVQRVHRIITNVGAGPVTTHPNSEIRTWKTYLLDVLSGDDPEFVWESIAQDTRFDCETLKRGMETIAQRVWQLPEPERLSLLHGDLNPYNIFVDQHEVTGIIDWSYARFGDPLFDFARLRMNPFVRSHPHTEQDYFALLALNPSERRREQTYYLFNLIEYLNWYYLDGEFERVHEHLRLIAHQVGVSGG